MIPNFYEIPKIPLRKLYLPPVSSLHLEHTFSPPPTKQKQFKCLSFWFATHFTGYSYWHSPRIPLNSKWKWIHLTLLVGQANYEEVISECVVVVATAIALSGILAFSCLLLHFCNLRDSFLQEHSSPSFPAVLMMSKSLV